MPEDQFGRLSFLESQPLSTERYHDDPEFAETLESVSQQIYPLIQSISKLTNDLAPLATTSEIPSHRLQILSSLRSLRSTASSIGAQVEKALSKKDVSPAQYLQQKSLRTTLSTTLTELATTHRIFLEKTHQYLDTLSHTQQSHPTSDTLASDISSHPPDPASGAPGPAPNAPLVAQQLALLETTADTPSPSLPSELEEERKRDVEETERGLEEIQALLGRVGLKMVQEETGMERVEGEVEEVAEDVGEVVEEVKERTGVREWGGRVVVGLFVLLICGGLVWMAYEGDKSREEKGVM